MSCKNDPNPKEKQPIVSSIASLLLVCLYPCLFQYAGNIPEARLWDALVFFGLFLAIGAVVYLIVLGITIVVNSFKSYAKSEKNSEKASA